METFYRSLNFATKLIDDTVSGGSFISQTYTDATPILDRVTKTNKSWYTKDPKVIGNTHLVGLSSKQHRKEEKRDQYMAHMKTQMDHLTKHLLADDSEKVKAIGSQGTVGRHGGMESDS